jgi:hypothetical protein
VDFRLRNPSPAGEKATSGACEGRRNVYGA